MATAGANRGGNGTAPAALSAPRPLPFGPRPLRTFALAIALPAFLLYVSSAVLAIVALVMMMQDMDRRERDRGAASMNAALISFLNGLSDTVADEGTWNEAHLNVVINSDPAWMDTTWGAAARLGLIYDDVMVTDGQGIIQFGENNIGPIRGDIAAHYAAAGAMLRQLDSAISATGDAAIVASFASDGQSPVGLAAISIHRSSPSEMTVPNKARRILWIAKHLTPALLQDIAVRYQTPLASIVTEVPDGDIALDMRDSGGTLVGTLAWTPDRPGAAAFRSALITVSAVFFAIGIPLVVGLGMLRRAMLRQAARIERILATADTAPAAAASAAPEPAAILPSAPRPPSVIAGISATNFTIDYQPTLDLRSESMVGVEALLRWVRADGSPLLQEELSAADLASMMERAGILALRHAAGELNPLLGVVLSLTITPAQLLNSIFAEKVAGTLGATNFPARRLQLSIDANLLPPAPSLIGPLLEFRRQGVVIAFTNFTLGAGTAAYVRPGLADRICLDQQIVANIDADPVRLKLVEATIEAARAASFAVTVPGIMRREDAARLLRLGCREFRGPLLAPPMNITALTSLILTPAKPQAKAG